MRMRAEQRQWVIGRSWRALERLLGPETARSVARWYPPLCEEATYRAWIAAEQPSAAELDRQRRASAAGSGAPLFSVIMPVFRPPLPALVAAVDSLAAQTYPRWELCVADAGPAGEASQWLAARAAADPRVKIRRLETNGGISANSNAAIDMAQGELLAFLDQDDALEPDALFHMADRVRAQPNVDLLYSDKDNITPRGERYAPLLKPGWSPELLLSANYITHLTVVRRALLDVVGRLDPAMDGAQDWDLFLRITERTTRIAHVPRVLYHWRSVPTSCASTMLAKPYALAAQRRAVSSHLGRRGIAAYVAHDSSGALRLRPARSQGPSVSRIAFAEDGPGWGARMNAAAASASGELILFWDESLRATRAEGLDELAFWAALPGIGAAGARVLGRGRRIERTGVVLGRGGEPQELLADARGGRWTIAGGSDWYRNLLAVGDGCFMTPRRIFRELGGFAEALHARAAVIDYGLRVHESGLRNVHVPFVTFEGRKRRTSTFSAHEIPPRLETYRASGDPFFSPHLSAFSQRA
jgi:O-antigen biosynthesis protein